MDDPAGEILDGRYVIGALLGSGGMAEVRHGHDQVLDRDVAIKLFRGQPEARLTQRERAEAQLLASLDHPGLVKVHDVGHSPVAGWVVMDLVDGPDLHQLLRGGALGPQQTWAIAHDVARTLAYVHAKGITHRDVKPSNVLTREAEPSSGRFGYVLTDFGIARRADSDRLTATGETIGTAAYFSPEQARGEAVDAATDIYALGLVLLECLTGEPAFEGRGLETALARLHRAPEIPAFVNSAWRDLISRMTAGAHNERPTAAEVASVLAAQRNAFFADAHADSGHASVDPSSGHGVEADPATMVLPGAARESESTRKAFVLGVNEQQAQPNQRTQRRAPKERRDPSGDGKPAERNRRWWVAGAVVVLVLVVLGVVLSGLFLQTPAPEPLPSVPGVPGERLSELYESVQS
ncbi:serine/threonine-protein kinase [uncultured Arthrobacter sp.]|uniref:serine/threonine-protein kinase n=1 Tax=uncultured Arthrobacter sp. TaxID=114050 RepID=UPI00261BF382|nr:serine/threonine-protein kinase [uncultured Arthrobacter sp.]